MSERIALGGKLRFTCPHCGNTEAHFRRGEMAKESACQPKGQSRQAESSELHLCVVAFPRCWILGMKSPLNWRGDVNGQEGKHTAISAGASSSKAAIHPLWYLGVSCLLRTVQTFFSSVRQEFSKLLAKFSGSLGNMSFIHFCFIWLFNVSRVNCSIIIIVVYHSLLYFIIFRGCNGNNFSPLHSKRAAQTAHNPC